MPWTREQLAERAAQELRPHTVVNLGIGIPTLVSNYLPRDAGILLHSENGILGMGPFPTDDAVDAQIINAGKQTVTIVDGGSTFDSALSFAMIRGGHVDVAILGAMQVSERGDLANWMIPGKKVAGIGGAMDLASGARRVIVVMSHRDRTGQSKLVKRLHAATDRTGLRRPGDYRPRRVFDSFRSVPCRRTSSGSRSSGD